MDWSDLNNAGQLQQSSAITGTLGGVEHARLFEHTEVPMNPAAPVSIWEMNARTPSFYEIINEPAVRPEPQELAHAWKLSAAPWSFQSEDIMNVEALPGMMEMLALIRKTRM